MCAAGRSMRANRPIRAVDWYPHPPRFSRLNVSHSGPNVMFCCMGPHMARGRWGVCRQALSIWLQALSWHWIRGMLGQTAMSQPMSAQLMPPIGGCCPSRRSLRAAAGVCREGRVRRQRSAWTGAWQSACLGSLLGLGNRRSLRRRQADRSEDSLAAEGERRLALIQAAIRRGEAKARAASPSEEQSEEPRRLTEEEEQMLSKLFMQPEEVMETIQQQNPQVLEDTTEEENGHHEERIRRTLEFCPDGKLAWEILREIIDSGEQPGVGAYDRVMEAFSRRGALDDALAVFKAVTVAGLRHSDVSYDLLARPAARSGEFRFVERLYAAKAQTKADGQIGAESLTLLLDAYANGLPRQAKKAQAAFRGAMATAEAADENAEAAEATEAGPGVLRALRRAVGPAVYRELCDEYGLEPDAE
ncbi:unnamed protein product [Effrenium voratum]|nr:unnamed protein product [Effrenium voratum]